MCNENSVVSPHVLILPLPLQGPVNSMLKLAELLCLNNINVTFLNTQHIQQRLLKCTNTHIYFEKYPNFRFETVPDGLPEDNPRTGDQIVNLLESMEASTVPVLRDMVTSGSGVYGPDSGTRFTCFIAEGVFTFATQIAKLIGVPLLYFDTISPCGLWSCMCCPKLIQAGEIPFKDEKLDEIIINAPGMEGIMRRRDLPSFCRINDVNDRAMQLLLEEVKHIPLAQGLIFNTFQQLEAPVLSQMRKISPNIYAVGPLHALLKTRLAAAETGQPTNSNSIWEEDRTCISWLDRQPPKSVIYVSIGSLAVMTKEQLFEIWYGLVNSGSRFLWARRPGSVVGLDSEPNRELLKGTEERGCIVSWAPQEEVLSHPAVGGFLTHSGWNSTLESIVEGKPMICWPYHADQQVNSRYVEQVWKLGLDMKDTCDRVIVQKMIRELRNAEFFQRAQEMAKLAMSSVTPGGSSFLDLDRLIQDIKTMKISI